MVRKGLPLDKPVKIGGMVEEGSVRLAGDGVTMDFVVGDETDDIIPVRYKGIVPDLLKSPNPRSLRPNMRTATWPLWAAPILLVAAGLYLARGRFKRRGR